MGWESSDAAVGFTRANGRRATKGATVFAIPPTHRPNTKAPGPAVFRMVTAPKLTPMEVSYFLLPNFSAEYYLLVGIIFLRFSRFLIWIHSKFFGAIYNRFDDAVFFTN